MDKTTNARILVVDDELPLMKALCHTLAEEGYQVTGASSGAEGITALRDSRHDVVLTDLMMPKMDGISLLKEAIALDPHVVGIVMTGHGSVQTAVDAMKMGATDYVLKPVKLMTLLPVLERALALRRLRARNAELEQRIRERTEELETVNQELEAYTSSVSHDLRTPLRAVSGLADILLNGYVAEMSAEVRRYVELIRTGTDEMADLITHLLAFSKVEHQPLVGERVDLQATFRDAYEAMAAERAGRVIEFKLHPLPQTIGDPALLYLVAINLLSNALKYSRRASTTVIEVGASTSPLAATPVYFVRDNGVGFDMSEATKLFTVFHRLHHAHDFEGTGVGLATVRRIVERHGGTIWAEASPGAGAVFRFTLPGRDAAHPM